MTYFNTKASYLDHLSDKPRKNLPCGRCGKLFEARALYQMFCSDDCENSTSKIMQDIADKKLNKKCRYCGVGFRRKDLRSTQTVCDGCSYQNAYIYAQEKSKLNGDKPKKDRKKISYEVLNRREEYKRVFRDSGWTHYIKGRKWDRI